MTTPIWLLDIDGVLNALGNKDEHYVWGDKKQYKREKCGGYFLQVPILLPLLINHYNEAGWVEVRWLTTWEQQAVDVFAPQFGFDKFPVQTESVGPKKFSDHWWKEDRFFAALNEGRPIVWTDDDLDEIGPGTIFESPDDSLLQIRPKTAVGLTPRHMQRIATFLHEFKIEDK